MYYCRNIPCPLCPKSFYTDETLKCHMISHYDTMYWACGLCSKNFKRIKNVKYHLRAAHALTDKLEIRRRCVKLRKAPTKAEIQGMLENRNHAEAELAAAEQLGGAEQLTVEQLGPAAELKTDFVLPDFKAAITTTFELTL